MAGDKADEPQQAPPDAVSDEFVDVEPIPIVVLGIIASGLVAALLVAIGELITETAPGLQLLFGAAIIILVLSTGWLLSAIQGRHRYVDAVTSRALDLAAKALSSNSAPEAQKTAIDWLRQVEGQLRNVGAYTAASEVAEPRRSLERIVEAHPNG